MLRKTGGLTPTARQIQRLARYHRSPDTEAIVPK
jgi:hypothetical protein